MAINFPNTPTVGDIHIENGNRFRWDGSGWIAIQEDATAIGDTPPSNPSPGDIWFDSANALLFIWYDDGNSQQWVNVTAGSVNPLWQTNSGDIYFDTGNVGIGTNTPASELDVNGDITVSGTVGGVTMSDVVTKVGTPVDNQIGVWTGDGTIEGDSNLTWDGSTLSTIDSITMSGSNSIISNINIIQGATSTNLIVEVLSGGIFRVDKFGAFFNENMIVANPDGSVELYHDDSLKLETTANGIEVTGDIVVSGTVDGIDLSTRGDVFKVGTPVDNQIGVWTGDGTIEGDTNLTWDGTNLEVTGAVRSGNFGIIGGKSISGGHFIRAHPKMWVYLSVGGGTPSAQDSFNLSSITDVGPGNFGFNITNGFATVNNAQSGDGASGVTTAFDVALHINNNTLFSQAFWTVGSTGSNTDPALADFIQIGELA